MTMLESKITSLTVVYTIVYSGVHQRKHQSSASLAFVREIHRGPVNFPHKWPVTRKMFPFDDVIMFQYVLRICYNRTNRSTTTLQGSGQLQWFNRKLSKLLDTFTRPISVKNTIYMYIQTRYIFHNSMHFILLRAPVGLVLIVSVNAWIDALVGYI